MQKIEIYSSPTCGYCHAAKRLLAKKGWPYQEYDLFRHPEKRKEMMKRSNGRHTVPQIFFGKTHVGGFDDMADLDRRGKLDALYNR